MTNNNKYNNNNGLNPNFSKFVVGVGCFYIGVSQNNNYSIGGVVGLTFSIGLDREDLLKKSPKTSLIGSAVKSNKSVSLMQVSPRRFYSTELPKPEGVKYSNADNEKLKILADNKGKSGVYM
jgi:hypothetical protein